MDWRSGSEDAGLLPNGNTVLIEFEPETMAESVDDLKVVGSRCMRVRPDVH